MKNYSLVFSNGQEKEFQAKNLREARKVATKIKGDYNCWSWIYEGYTPKVKI